MGKKKASKPPVRRARVSKAANVDEKPSAIPAPAQHSTINYSKFDLIDVSDEEEEDPVTGPSALEHGPHHLHEGAMEGSSGEGCPMCGADHSAIESNSPATAPSDEEEDSGDDGTDTVVRQDEDGGTLVSMKVVPGLLDSPGFERALKKGFLKGGRPSSSSSSGPAKTRVGEADAKKRRVELDEDGLPPLLSASDVDDEVPLNVLREQGYEAFMEASLTNLTSHEAALDQRETLTMPVELALTEPTGKKEASEQDSAHTKAAAITRNSLAALAEASKPAATADPPKPAANAEPPKATTSSKKAKKAAKATKATGDSQQKQTEPPGSTNFSNNVTQSQKSALEEAARRFGFNISATHYNDVSVPGCQSDEEEVERYSESVACGLMEPGMAANLRNGGHGLAARAQAGKSDERDAKSSAFTFSKAASKAQGSPPVAPTAKSAAQTSKTSTSSPANTAAAVTMKDNPRPSSPNAKSSQHAPAAAAGSSSSNAKGLQQALAAAKNPDAKPAKGKADSSVQPIPTEDIKVVSSDLGESEGEQKRPSVAKQSPPGSKGLEQARRDLQKASEEHFLALLEEEERQKKESEQNRRLQDERDNARREKRKAKTKKKKERKGDAKAQQKAANEAGSAAALSLLSGQSAGEGSSKDHANPADDKEDADEVRSQTAEALQPEAPPEETPLAEVPIATATFAGTYEVEDPAAQPEPLEVQEVEDDEEGSDDDLGSEDEGGGGASSSNPFDILLNRGKSKRPPAAGRATKREAESASARVAKAPQPIDRRQEPKAAVPRAPPMPPYLPPPPTGHATPDQLTALHQAWMPLHYALGKDDPAAIIAAMAAAEGWLAQYDGSKVFMSANTELRNMLGRARQRTGHQRGPVRPGPNPGRFGRPTPQGLQGAAQRLHRPPQQFYSPAADLLQPPRMYTDDPFGGVLASNTAGGVAATNTIAQQPRPPQPIPMARPAGAAAPFYRPYARAPPPPPAAVREPPPVAATRARALPEPAALDQRPAAVAPREDTNGPGNEDLECIVCYEWPPQVVLYPCGHNNMCEQCAKGVKNTGEGLCPTCRAKIIEIVRPEK